MDEVAALVMVPTILFMLFVAPIWVIMHYRSKRASQGALSEAERAELERLAVAAEGMRERIDTLESILDVQTPQWRQRAAVER